MYCEFRPGENLSRLIRAYMYLEEKDTRGYFFAPAIKHTGIIIATKSNVEVNCNNQSFVPAVVSMKGVFEFPYFYKYQNNYITSFATDFHSIGMYELTGRPGAMFKNKFLDAKEIWTDNEVNELASLLSQDISLDERIQLFDSFLEEKAPKILSEKSLLVEKAVDMAQTNHYRQSVRSICLELGVSERMLGRAFKEVLGIVPKQYFTFSLFEEIIKQYAINKETSIAAFVDSPFYDFSHINKWFKKFAHTSPKEFVNFDLHSVGCVLAEREI